MAIKIDEDSMSAEVDGSVVATANRTGDRWSVRTWPAPLTRNPTITAPMLAERLTPGHGDGDPLVTAWGRELSGG